jgi:phosphoribosylanthranilate isomerase
MHGPNLHLLRDVCARTSKPVIASGGISKLEDLHKLAEMVPQGIEGAIVGRALYDGAFTLVEAIAAVEPRFDPYTWGPPQP